MHLAKGTLELVTRPMSAVIQDTAAPHAPVPNPHQYPSPAQILEHHLRPPELQPPSTSCRHKQLPPCLISPGCGSATHDRVPRTLCK
ncbi:uncharacterized protein M421DRAFT_316673 [Didymella exigua CBS 183.55]|uniref:Uncharacterized protein n=1 Tax=Didymella exigua CBS 183.55 TaxID=1150837 RepID=A0A6A5RWP8_9PLEO|nr:uncharacterized protein M421DRAFT_316673 [Didymella exigua CBS 183.55]KAF1931624.1 hypothetical protein M421DRAFT_316673 [Didymella exigua CBS 183.55]